MFKRILLPVKLKDPETWSDALAIASRLASDHGACLTLATIIPHWIDRDADYSWEARKWFERRAATGLNAIRAQQSHRRCEILVHWGSVPGSILDMAEDVRADLIVLPAKDPHISDLFHRPAALRLAGRAACSVMLVRSMGNQEASAAAEALNTAS